MLTTPDAAIQEVLLTTVERLAERLCAWDYEIRTEAELCHLFFLVAVPELQMVGIPARSLRSEVPVLRGGRVDFGLSTSDEASNAWHALIDAKVWVRPLDVSPWSKSNQSTAKRNQCIADARRLAALIGRGVCRLGALLILERNSSHLRRLLVDSAASVGIACEPRWFDLERRSAGRHKEHLGLLCLKRLPPSAEMCATGKIGNRINRQHG